MEEPLNDLALNYTPTVNISPDEKERKLFMQDLNKFMSENGKPLSKIPIMGYKELDLYQLFKEVLAYGGFNEVVKNVGTWSKIWKKLANFDPSITDSSFRLKKNYERYLLDYELKCKPENRQQTPELRFELRTRSSLRNNITNEITNSPNSSFDSSSISSSSPSMNKKTLKQNKKAIQNSISLETISKIPRTPEGSPLLPIDLGDFILESLGTIINKSPFVTDKHIYPVGFRISRMFPSMMTPEINVKYTCSILNSNDKPLFVITPEDECKSIQSHSPSGAWRTVFKRLALKNEDPTNSPSRKSINGNARFGLVNPIVIHLLKEMFVTSDSSSSSPFNLPASPILSNLSPLNSPNIRKRKSSIDLNEDSLNQKNINNYQEEEEPMKFPRVETVMISSKLEEIVFHSRQELEDLERAVATLNLLKFCTVY